MFNRDRLTNNSQQPKIKQVAYSLAEGTAIGASIRGLTWAFEKTYMDKSNVADPRKYSAILKQNFAPRNLYDLTKTFVRTGALQTILKSASTIGIMHMINMQRPDFSPSEKLLWNSVLGIPAEIASTSRGEWMKTLAFYKLNPQSTSILSINFARALAGNSIRIAATTIATFKAIFDLEEYMKQRFPTYDPVKRKALAAGLASFLIQPVNMPFINFQTWALKNTDHPFRQIVSSFFQAHSSPAKLLAGVVGRCCYRSLYYFLTFYVSELAKLHREKQSNESESAAKMRRV